jgi:hypothetical protein
VSDEVSVRFVRLVTAGRTPEAAWLMAMADRAAATARPVTLGQLRLTEKGYKAMASSRRRWAALGLTPPWEAGRLPEYPQTLPSKADAGKRMAGP